MRATTLVQLGAVFAAVGVAAGAISAHGLRDVIDPEYIPVFETGARYNLFHALGMIAIGLTKPYRPASRGLDVAAWGIVVGTVLFSGSLYGLALSGMRWLGAITPIGGLAQLIGWIGFAVGARRGLTPPGAR